MALLGRDLAPRRRPRRRVRLLLAVLVVLAAGAAVYLVSAPAGHARSSPVAARPTLCPATTRPPSPAAAAAVTVTVLNGTLRPHLAHVVAVQLRRRWFRIHRVGDTPRLLARTTVRYPTGAEAAARALTEELARPARSAQAGTVVELDLGSDYTGLASPQRVAAARARDLAAASPSPACAARR